MGRPRTRRRLQWAPLDRKALELRDMALLLSAGEPAPGELSLLGVVGALRLMAHCPPGLPSRGPAGPAAATSRLWLEPRRLAGSAAERPHRCRCRAWARPARPGPAPRAPRPGLRAPAGWPWRG